MLHAYLGCSVWNWLNVLRNVKVKLSGSRWKRCLTVMTVDKLFKALWCIVTRSPPQWAHFKVILTINSKTWQVFFSFFSPLFLFKRINFSCPTEKNYNENFALAHVERVNTELKKCSRSAFVLVSTQPGLGALSSSKKWITFTLFEFYCIQVVLFLGKKD